MTSTSYGPRRLHVTTACASCRESKVKCDSASPPCSNCKAKGKECNYKNSDDKRKLTLRAALELISSYVNQLHNFISDHSLEAPSMDAEDYALLLKILTHQRVPLQIKRIAPGRNEIVSENNAASLLESEDQFDAPSRARNSVPESDSSPVLCTTIPSTRLRLEDLSSLDDPTVAMIPQTDWNSNRGDATDIDFQPLPFVEENEGAIVTDLHIPELYQPQSFHNSENLTARQHNEEEEDSQGAETLVDQLSERIGSMQIGPRGHIRYYGPTSNFNLVHMSIPDTFALRRTVRSDSEDHLNRLGLGRDAPLALQNHLVNLYFTWQDPSLHVVNRDIYETAKASWNKMEGTPYYSEALHNAICALGAAFESRHHPSFPTFPKYLADFFAERAKVLLEIELDSPYIATVQALAVLSSHEVGYKRDSRGWLYSGMAMRLSFDLGLHIDMTPHVASGSLSEAEAELRKAVFWGVYVIDHTWGFHLGRPFRINMEGSTVSKPIVRASPTTSWTPYNSHISKDHSIGLPDCIQELHQQRISLAGIMTSVACVLYGNLQIDTRKLQEINAEAVARLLKWRTDLPFALRVDLDDAQTYYLPHVLLLHMQYHQNIIYAHRPYMSRTYVQPFPPQGPGSDHARMMCMESSQSIAKLLQLYEIRFSLRRINVQAVGIVCSAALLLIFANVTQYRYDGVDKIEEHLSACFRALEEMGSSWESAKRSQDFLLTLRRQWELQVRSARAQEAGSRKRQRTSRTLGSESGNPYQSLRIPEQNTNTGTHFTINPLDMEMGLDLDWADTEFPFAMPQDPFYRL